MTSAADFVDPQGGTAPPPRRATVVGLAGGSGAGKTTIVRGLRAALAPDLGLTLISHDNYYRDHGHVPPGDREAINYDHPDEFETGLLVEHLRALRDGACVEAPSYDFTTHTRSSATHPLEPADVLVVEGILVLADGALRGLFDLEVFIAADAATRLERRIQRDVGERGRSVASVREQFAATVAPMHDAFVEPSKAFADLVLDGRDAPDVSVERLTAHLGAFITTSRPGPIADPHVTVTPLVPRGSPFALSPRQPSA